MSIPFIVLILIASLIIPWLISFIVEALRRAPAKREGIFWDTSLKPSYINVNGVNTHYIKTGHGPVLVLLHTLRTQLELFHKVIPELSKHYTIYAPDYPGHGHSDINDGEYDANFFVKHVTGFLDALDLKNITLSGVSIGASITLIIAARQNPRVDRIIPINPYDYYKGKGLARSSLLGRFIVTASPIPFIGETVMRLRNFIIMKLVLQGGVNNPSSISPSLMKEMYMIGNRPGHYRAFLKLLRNAASWERARNEYSNINIPTLIVWGEKDWSRIEERRFDESLIANVKSVTVKNGGHFLPFDAPQEIINILKECTEQAQYY